MVKRRGDRGFWDAVRGGPEFWELVAAKLAEEGRTEIEVGAELGVSGASVNRWRNRVNIPHPSHYAQIAKWLGLSVSDLASACARQDIQVSQERLARKLRKWD